MTPPTPELSVLHDLLRHLDGAEPRSVQVERQPLRGGLEAADVERLSLRYADGAGRERRRAVVTKRLVASSSGSPPSSGRRTGWRVHRMRSRAH